MILDVDVDVVVVEREFGVGGGENGLKRDKERDGRYDGVLSGI